MNNIKSLGATFVLIAGMGVSGAVSAAQIYANGFETDIDGWYTPTRTASGTGGVTSSSGSWHAIAAGDFTRFGGYNFGAGNNVGVAFQEYYTAIDIYLDVDGGLANDTRFDYTVANSDSSGAHRRDFIFSGGFYNDSDSTGSGNRFVFNTSNNSPGWPKNPGRTNVTLADTGWYTFEHHFYDNGGQLAVDMSIFDVTDTLLASWTLSDASDTIGPAGTVGGSRYGWFATNAFPDGLAIDNVELRTVDAQAPEPATLALLGLGLVGLGWNRRRS